MLISSLYSLRLITTNNQIKVVSIPVRNTIKFRSTSNHSNPKNTSIYFTIKCLFLIFISQSLLILGITQKIFKFNKILNFLNFTSNNNVIIISYLFLIHKYLFFFLFYI